MGGIVWFTNDDPNMAPFTPVFCGSTAELTASEKYAKFLTDHSLQKGTDMMNRWQQLFLYIMGKHNDMAVRKLNPDGSFKQTPLRSGRPRPDRPGYPEAYRRRIVRETGDRYLIK